MLLNSRNSNWVISLLVGADKHSFEYSCMNNLDMFGFMVFNATFINISVISLRSLLLAEETGVHGENHRPAASHWQMSSHNVAQFARSGIRNHYINGDRHQLHIDSCKSNYHAITSTTPPCFDRNIMLYVHFLINIHLFL